MKETIRYLKQQRDTSREHWQKLRRRKADVAKAIAQLTPDRYAAEYIATETRARRDREREHVERFLAEQKVFADLDEALSAADQLTRRAQLERATFGAPIGKPAELLGLDDAKGSKLAQSRTLDALDRLLEETAASRWEDRAARMTPNQLRSAAEKAAKDGNLALLRVIRDESGTRADGGDMEARKLAADVNAIVDALPSPEADEAAELATELEQLKTAITETVRSIDAGDVDRSERWQHVHDFKREHGDVPGVWVIGHDGLARPDNEPPAIPAEGEQNGTAA